METLHRRRTTLDPALTLLALRGRRDPDVWLPFLDRVTRRRRWWTVAAGGLASLARWGRPGATRTRIRASRAGAR